MQLLIVHPSRARILLFASIPQAWHKLEYEAFGILLKPESQFTSASLTPAYFVLLSKAFLRWRQFDASLCTFWIVEYEVGWRHALALVNWIPVLVEYQMPRIQVCARLVVCLFTVEFGSRIISSVVQVQMPFLEIAYQAEVSRYDDPEFKEHARTLCNEDPATRAICLEEFRRRIYERGEVTPRRMDDAYLLRFLRCRSFVVPLAHRLLVRYEEFRLKHAHLYEGIDCFALQKVKYVYGGTLPDSPENGRITLMRFGKWEAEKVPIDDVVRCALLMDEVAVLQPRLQILGVTIIVDLEGLSYRHVRQLTPNVANEIVSLMGISFPLNTRGIHLINYSWILNTFFYVFKRFIPSYAWNRIHFHGYDMSSLHKHIDPEYLPPEYGGHCQYVVTIEEWIRKIQKYKDDFLVHELKDLGFVVRD